MSRTYVGAAVVVPGLREGGGVPALAKYLAETLLSIGLEVTVVDLATSMLDPDSSRIVDVRSWSKSIRLQPVQVDAKRWKQGAHFAEVEPLRYLPRSRLTTFLNAFDVVQLVAGTPAWANVLWGLNVPCAAHFATTTLEERGRQPWAGVRTHSAVRKALSYPVGYMDGIGVRIPDRVMVINSQMLSWCNAKRRSDDALLAYHGINTDFFTPRGIWNPLAPLVSVGRLDERRKGWTRLLSAYAHLKRINPSAPSLRLVGQGTLADSDVSLIRELGIVEHIEIRSNVTIHELKATLQTSSAFVQTSYEEGLGVAALEAMACGLPVLATTTAGSREYVYEGRTGFLLPQNDELLPQALLESWGKLRDGAGWAAAAEARGVCETTFSKSVTSGRIASVYSHMLG